MILALSLQQQLNGNNMKSILIAFFVFFTFVSFGQKYADIGEKEGKKYYIHQVESEQSLYSISKLYEIPIEELKRYNPSLSAGLQLGQVLWIPVLYDDITHIVQHRETLYGISRRYSQPIDSIIAYNPQITEGLQRGQELIIKNIIRPIQIQKISENPFSTNSETTSKELNYEDSLVEYTVHPGETLYSISRRFMVPMDTLMNRNKLQNNVLSEGQVLIIPLKKELEIKERVASDSLYFPTKTIPKQELIDSSKRSIVVFLPFNLDTIDVRNIRKYALDYYMGALLAIDSLKKYNVQCDFHFFDYESKIRPFDSILNTQELLSSDLIFAPFNLQKAKKLKEWSAEKSTKIVFPLKRLNSLYDFRSNEFFMEPDAAAKQYILAKHLSNLDSCQLIFIKTPDSSDQRAQNKFLEIYYNINASTKLIEADMNSFKFFVNKENTKTVYVLLSENETIVEDVLKFAGEKEHVLVYGKEEWLKRIKFVSSIENIAPYRYAVGTFLDYHNESIKYVHRMYRRKFNSDMSKMSGIGYDATLNMVMYLLYNKELDNGLVHNFKFDFQGSPINHNIGGYILNFENLNISTIE